MVSLYLSKRMSTSIDYAAMIRKRSCISKDTAEERYVPGELSHNDPSLLYG